MNINDLTVGQAKELIGMFAGNLPEKSTKETLNTHIGEKVIIRTYSAGVWFGTLSEKAGNEVILMNARRMWLWHAAKSISLSGVANFGITQSKSKIAPAVGSIWLEAIEIIPATPLAINSIEGAPDAQTE